MRRLRAFILGAYEFRRDFTTSFDSHAEYCAYDWGRELAHRATFRRWDWDYKNNRRPK